MFSHLVLFFFISWTFASLQIYLSRIIWTNGTWNKIVTLYYQRFSKEAFRKIEVREIDHVEVKDNHAML